MKKANSVEHYIEQNNHFKDEIQLLRELLLSTSLKETLKWSAPVYTIDNKNVIGLGAFKHHFCLWFFNGVFLKDKHQLLVNAQENKTKALRQLRFNAIEDIDKSIVLEYINEAIENQKAGKVFKAKKVTKAVVIPELFQDVLDNNKALNTAFNKLNDSKKREYCEHISSAKRETTKLSRIEKIIPQILNGQGLHDKYKNC